MWLSIVGFSALGLLVGGPLQFPQADGHKGPHGGIVVEWGEEELHPEIVVDQTVGKVMVFVYGNHAELGRKKLKPIAAKSITLVLKDSMTLTLTLNPSPEKSDPRGQSSKFTTVSEDVIKISKFKGTLSAKIGARHYSSDFR